MLWRVLSGIVMIFLTVMPVGSLLAQEEIPEKRLALVIGNGDYLIGPLPNPVNDARSMARALRMLVLMLCYGRMSLTRRR